MRADWRPLEVWPHPEQAAVPSPFKADWSGTVRLLDDELANVDAGDPVIGLVMPPSSVTINGQLKPGAEVLHRGAELSFTRAGKRLVFQTSRFPTWRANLRAIALGLHDLRRLERYGITHSDQQYAGFAMLEDPVSRGARLVAEAGSIEDAIKRWHPDKGGDARAFQDVIAYRRSVE